MNCTRVISRLIKYLKDDDICIFTTGFISRRAFAAEDRKSNFYMLGSMGLASSVGLGIALNASKRVIVIDGDGSALMDLGTMVTISDQKPVNLYHVILDNGCYESTGGQNTLCRGVDLAAVAKAAGYRTVLKINSYTGISERLFSGKGPLCAVIKICRKDRKSGRVGIEPVKLANRIKEVLSGKES